MTKEGFATSVLIATGFIALIAGVISGMSCSTKAASTPIVVEVFNAPAGVRCFALMDGDRVAGGSCISQ